MENVKSKTAPQNYKRLLTKEDYVNTREAIEYCKKVIPEIRKKIPYQFARPIRKILLKNGFDYSLKYIRDSIRVTRTLYNIHIIQAAEKLIEVMGNPCDTQIYYDPEADSLRAPKKRGKPKKSIAESQGLVKC